MITNFTWANVECQKDGTSILKLTRETGEVVEFHCSRFAISGLHELTRALKEWKPDGYDETLEDRGLIGIGGDR
ncbi:MAG: hypothetical protein AAF414_16250 [Pseudomonadota bacterium]